MPNLRSCDKGNMRPNSRSFDYKSYSMTPSTASLKSAPLIYAAPDRNQYLVSTLNGQALARSNLVIPQRILAFGKPIKNCNTPYNNINPIGILRPIPNKQIKTKQIQVDNKGRYYYNYGKRYNSKTKK
jgi:hypothetical protein